MILNKDKRSLVLSLILGDGCLHWSKNYNSTTGYLHVKHSLKQEDYLLWKVKLLSDALNRFDIPVYNSQSYVKVLDKSYDQIRLQVGMRRFRTWYKLFYPNRKKNLAKMLDFIVDKTLAASIWLGDDGTVGTGRMRSRVKDSPRKANALVLYTCDQDEESTNKCILWFKKYFDVEPKLKYHKCIYKGELKSYPIIRFNLKESLKLWEQIRHILLEIPSMKLKFKMIEERYQEFRLQPQTTYKIS